MPLTPADVHNMEFKKTSIGKRGYDEEEVDAFLDDLEQALVGLIEENHQLRGRVARGGPAADPRPSADPRLSAELDMLSAQLDRVRRDKATAEHASPGNAGPSGSSSRGHVARSNPTTRCRGC